jgi:selenocysteine lyase/cysteine desulfurase
MVPCNYAVMAIEIVSAVRRMWVVVFIDALQLAGHLRPLKKM